MKILTTLPIIAVSLGLHTCLLVCSCAPNPELQKQMDQNMRQASGNTATQSESATQDGLRDTKADQGGF